MNEHQEKQPTTFQQYQLLQLNPETRTGDVLTVNEALLGELLSAAHSKDHVPIISFIGGAGVGKSSLICSLLEESVDAACRPVIAAPHQMLTETAGVYVYPCTTLPLPGELLNNQRVILADFEGAGGQIPRTVNQRLLEEVPVVHWLHRIVAKHLEKRKKLTMKTLPSLAFLLSDVVVYVHQSPVSDINMLDTIAAIARDASKGVEYEWKPALVILKNKSTAVNFNIDGIDATDSFLNNIHMSEELQNLYQSVRVMSLPQSNDEENFKRSLNVLKSTIGELRRDVIRSRQAMKIRSVGISSLLSENLFWTLVKDMIHCVNSKLRDAGSGSSWGEFFENLPGLATKRLCRIDNKSIFFDRFFTQVSENILGSTSDHDGGMTKYRGFYDKLVGTAMESLTGSIAYTLAANMSMYGEDDEFVETMEPEIQNILEASTETVESYCPCRAESPPLDDGEMFPCTLTAGEHGDFHENPDARITKTNACFQRKEKDCSKWKGEFEGRATSPTSDECMKHIQQGVASKSIRDIAKAQVEVLQRFQEADICNSTDVCTICFSAQAEPPLPCGHRMCTADQKLLNADGNCPFGCRGNLEDSRLSLAQSTSSDTRDEPVSMPESNLIGVRVLALDGGGSKGIFQAMVLDAVYKKITPFAPGIPFRELFDLIIGTSIGSAVGAAIGRMNFSPIDARRLIEDSVSTIFVKSGWRRFSGTTLAVLSGTIYSNKNLQKLLEDGFGDTTLSGAPVKVGSKASLSSTDSLSQSQTSETLRPRSLRSVSKRLSMSVDMLQELKEECEHTLFQHTRRRPSLVVKNDHKMFQHVGRRSSIVIEEEEEEFTPPTDLVLPVVACCAYDMDRVKTVTLSGHDCSLKAREAVLASTAAPTYFPSVQLLYKGEKRQFCDGAIGANCPAGEGKKLAKEVWPDRRIDTMLSVGCGGDATSDARNPNSIAKIGAALLNFVVRTEQHWNELEKDNDCFVRLDAPARVGIGELPLNCKDVDKIKRLAVSWLDEPETQQQVDFTACVLSAKFFYLKCPDVEVLTWQPGQECRIPICQRKARYSIQSGDLRAVARLGDYEMPCEVRCDPGRKGDFIVTFHCPRRPFVISVRLCILGESVEVSGSPLVFNVAKRDLTGKWFVTLDTAL
ncbi:uncharacterized protein LOC144868313 [Branchiostoma floridae x Branchiostoma japonicum]